MVIEMLAQVDGEKAGLPIVCVDDIGPPIEHARQFECGAGEKRKAGAVIGVVAAGTIGTGELVETPAKFGLVAVEHVAGAYEPDRHGGTWQGGAPEFDLDAIAGADGDATAQIGLLTAASAATAFEQGHDDLTIDT